MLDAGSIAPEFTAFDQDGKAVGSRDLVGSWVVLWWYPKASTPG